MIGNDDGLASLSPVFISTRIGDAEAKLAPEEDWIDPATSGKSAAEVLGLAPAILA